MLGFQNFLLQNEFICIAFVFCTNVLKYLVGAVWKKYLWIGLGTVCSLSTPWRSLNIVPKDKTPPTHQCPCCSLLSHTSKMPWSMTTQEETVEDALLAVVVSTACSVFHACCSPGHCLHPATSPGTHRQQPCPLAPCLSNKKVACDPHYLAHFPDSDVGYSQFHWQEKKKIKKKHGVQTAISFKEHLQQVAEGPGEQL